MKKERYEVRAVGREPATTTYHATQYDAFKRAAELRQEREGARVGCTIIVRDRRGGGRELTRWIGIDERGWTWASPAEIAGHRLTMPAIVQRDGSDV